MAKHPRQVPRQRTVDVFHEREVSREEDVEVALLNLSEEAKEGVVSKVGTERRVIGRGVGRDAVSG